MKTLLFLMLIVFQSTFSQNFSEENIRNTTNLEVGGHSESIISVNYERLFLNSNVNFIYLLSIGFGRNPGADKEGGLKFPATTSLPLLGGFLYGKKNHFAQLKFGYVPIFSKDFVNPSINPTTIYKKFQSDYSLSIGYRFMSNDGIVAQIFPLFIWRQNPTEKFNISFGVSLGYAF